MAATPARSRPFALSPSAEPVGGRVASRLQGVRELVAAALWTALGGWLFAAGLQAPVRPLLLWGGALPITWGLTRAVIGLWHLISAARRGS